MYGVLTSGFGAAGMVTAVLLLLLPLRGVWCLWEGFGEPRLAEREGLEKLPVLLLGGMPRPWGRNGTALALYSVKLIGVPLPSLLPL